VREEYASTGPAQIAFAYAASVDSMLAMRALFALAIATAQQLDLDLYLRRFGCQRVIDRHRLSLANRMKQNFNNLPNFNIFQCVLRDMLVK